MITKETLDSYFYLFNGKYKRLTRKFDQDLPEFSSHQEARNWFKDLFGDDFMLTDSMDIDGEKMWDYELVIDRPAWKKGMKEMNEKGFSSGVEFMMATHTIQIFDSGKIHVVH